MRLFKKKILINSGHLLLLFLNQVVQYEKTFASFLSEFILNCIDSISRIGV